MKHHSILVSTLFVTALAACVAEDGGSDRETVSGSARFRDASTDASGSPQPAARPAPQDASVELIVEGQALLTGMPSNCVDRLSGQFEALYAGELAIGDGGAYAGGFGSAVASLTTPSGCEIPDLTVQLITGVTLRAELQATTTNCESYCSAEARAEAQSACAGDADQVSCRAEAEAAARAECSTTCTQQAHTIVAQASLSVESLAELDAEALRAAALGQFSAELTFDHMVDESGQRVGR